MRVDKYAVVAGFDFVAPNHFGLTVRTCGIGDWVTLGVCVATFPICLRATSSLHRGGLAKSQICHLFSEQ